MSALTRTCRPAALLCAFAFLCLAGCVRKWPVFYAPVWSPDGARLYYVVTRGDGSLAIREVDVAAGRGQELTVARFAAPPAAVALSPQGDKVACAVVAREAGRPPVLRLHVASREGKADRVIWEAPCGQGAVDLCWLPDGRSVLAAADRPGGSGLYRVPVDGAAAQTLVGDLCETRSPSVSPDGQRVAFVGRGKPEEPWALHLAAIGGGVRKVLAPAIFREYGVGYWPAWSPRGNAVAYVAERYLCPGFADILLWDAASGERRALARTRSGASLAPTWSPGGDAVAFVSLPLGVLSEGPGAKGQPADILVVDAAGKSTLTVVADGLANLMPAWSPDGRQLAFNTCGEPGPEPHAVRIASLDTAAVRLAESTPEAQFLLAAARWRRAGPLAVPGLDGPASRVADPLMVALASRIAAEASSAKGDWAAAARHAARGAAAADAEGQLDALRLLAKARMRLGDAKGALDALDAILSRKPDEAAAARRRALAEGNETAARLEAELKATPSPVLLQAVADTYLRQLGNPRKALDLLFRLAKEFPEGPHLRAAAESVLAASEELGAQAASYRMLEWAAKTVGEAALTPPQRVLLAETAAHNGDPKGALRWLEALPPASLPGGLAQRASAAAAVAADHLAAANPADDALAAYRRAMALAPGPAAARAALGAARLLAARGGHWEASRLLLGALGPGGAPATRREALRVLTLARLQRHDPLAYDVAEVGELVAFGFLDAAIARGEQLIVGIPREEPSREALRGCLSAGYDKLVDYHQARWDATAALGAARRWLRWASRGDDLPRALARLAACHEMAGDGRALVETLSAIALQFPDRPEGAEARRRLLLLDTPRPRSTPGP